VPGHHELIVNDDQRMWQIALRGNIQDLSKPLLDLLERCVIVRNVDLLAIDAREKGLCLLRGLLRRPSRPSTPHTYFVPAVPKDDDLDLFFDRYCLFHSDSYLYPQRN
jgi:hypothetical protein